MLLANYTTVIDVNKSIAEIQKMLVQFGAGRISMHYWDGKPSGVEFAIMLDGSLQEFRLPVNAKAALTVLQGMKVTANQKKEPHADKVAWRILRDWVRIQLSIVEMKQAEVAQVFLPYALVQGEGTTQITVYQGFRAARQKQLGVGK